MIWAFSTDSAITYTLAILNISQYNLWDQIQFRFFSKCGRVIS
jgi:hypothetical protein